VPDFTSQPSFASSDSRFVAVAARGVSGLEKSNGTDNSNKKKDFYGLDQKLNQTNRKPKWFGSVLGSNF
jgi:hypothetical protein